MVSLDNSHHPAYIRYQLLGHHSNLYTNITYTRPRNTTPRIGDLLTQFAPFLKLYTEYVRDFDKATGVLNECLSASPEFAALITKLQVNTSDKTTGY